MSTTPSTTTVQTASATYAYRRTGPVGGVPLVLLMRFRGTIDDWDPALIEPLSRNRDVILVDNVGTGRSTGEPRDSMEGAAAGIIDFVEALELTQVDLLGWSLGGVVAQYVVDARPDLVRRVVVAASTPGLVPDTPAPDARVTEIQMKPDATAGDMAYLFYPDTDDGRAAAAASDARIAAARPTDAVVVSDRAAGAQLVAASVAYQVPVPDLVARLARTTQPVLFANGVQDVGIPASASVFGATHAPHGTALLYGDAGHAFLFQHAEHFAATVDLFLR